MDLQAAAALSRRWCAGCTIAILVERGQAYFAHIRPRSSAPNAHLAGQANRADLAYNMQQFGGFDGQGLTDPRHYIVYGGNAASEVSDQVCSGVHAGAEAW